MSSPASDTSNRDPLQNLRLPYPRPKWPTISDQELSDLLKRAIDAPIRQKMIGEESPINR